MHLIQMALSVLGTPAAWEAAVKSVRNWSASFSKFQMLIVIQPVALNRPGLAEDTISCAPEGRPAASAT